MTKTTNGTAPELIVLGRDEQGRPHAARFPANEANTLAKAAKAMNFTVCKAKGAALADLAEKLRFGRLDATGCGFVPAIRRNLYGKLVEQLKLAGQPVPDETVGRPPSSQPLGCPAVRTTSRLVTWCSPGRRRSTRLVGGHRPRPGRRHADPEMA